MEILGIEDLANKPGQLRQYFSNGGVMITGRDGRVIAEVPPAIEPAPPEAEDLTIVNSDWLD